MARATRLREATDADATNQEGDLATGSGAPSASAEPKLEAALGAQVRELRTALGMTIKDLANQAGLSLGMLSKIETGAISASLSTLQALATALNVPITTLFTKFEQRRDVSYVPAGQGLTIDRRGTKAGHNYELLGHSLGGDVVVEPYLIRLESDARPYAAFRHEGVELIYMLEGEVAYRHGDQIFDLKPGDALLFDSAAPHGPEELTKCPMRYLSIITYRRSAGR